MLSEDVQKAMEAEVEKKVNQKIDDKIESLRPLIAFSYVGTYLFGLVSGMFIEKHFFSAFKR